MKIKKIDMKKRGVSEMISYVILIAIGIGLSIGVFIWLKDFANVSPKIDCKEGTSLRLDNYSIVGNTITLTLKNNGNFNISGFILYVGNNTRIMPIKLLTPIGSPATPIKRGYWDFSPPLNPDSTKVASFLTEGYNVKVIQIQPYVKDEKGEKVVCEKAVIKQEVSKPAFNPWAIPSLVSGWKFDDNTQDSKDGNHGILYGFSISSCESTTGWTAYNGNIATNSDKIEGSNSLKLTATTDDGYTLYNPAGTFDFSNDDIISFWAKSGTGSELTNLGEVFIANDPTFTNFCRWVFSYPANWGLIRLNISNPASPCAGTIDLSTIDLFRFDVNQNGASGLVDMVNLNKNYVSGQQGNALSFDGVGDYVNLTSFNNLDSVSEFTISMWIYKNTLLFPNYAGIIARGNGTGGQRTPWVYGGNTDQYLTMQFKTDTGGTADCSVNSDNIPAMTWTNVVAWWNGTTCAFFVNGTMGLEDTTSGSTLVATDGFNYIGYINGYGYFNGSIDDVMIFNEALDETTIQNIYCSQGGTTGCP